MGNIEVDVIWQFLEFYRMQKDVLNAPQDNLWV